MADVARAQIALNWKRDARIVVRRKDAREDGPVRHYVSEERMSLSPLVKPRLAVAGTAVHAASRLRYVTENA